MSEIPAETPPEDEPSLGLKLGVMLLSCLVTAGLSEGLLRLADGGAWPQLPIFVERPGPGIALAAEAAARVRRKTGGAYEVRTDRYGLRVGSEPSPRGGWLVVGDSQVLGQGVEADESFTARLGAAGLPAANAGVPGYGVADELALAEDLLPALSPAGVLVVIDQANDWEDAAAPVSERYQVRGGWLVASDEAGGLRGPFLDSPLSRLHLGFYAGWYLLRPPASEPEIPRWLSDPRAELSVSQSLTRLIDRFAARHRALTVAAAFLPVDVAVTDRRRDSSPFAAFAAAVDPPPWEDRTLRDQILSFATVPTFDLSPALLDCPDCFLERDYHLSALGHARVAEALLAQLPPLAQKTE